MAQLRTVELSHPVYRVARRGDPLRFSTITPADAVLPKAGNRYDIPGGEVLYVASSAQACFGETLARFRPSASMRARLEGDPEAGFMRYGHVPRDWRLNRVLANITADDPLPFLDVEDPGTHEVLSDKLTAQLAALGYEESLDVSDVRGRDRRMSRAIANWAYTAETDEGEYRFSGIRYLSRLDDEWECWAVFDGTDVVENSQSVIDESNSDLRAVADRWGLRVF